MSATRRLLLVSYHFGPECETGGYRWNAMASYLASHGWQVDVIALARPGFDRPYEFVPGVRVVPVTAPTHLENAIAWAGRVRRRLRAGGAAASVAKDPGADPVSSTGSTPGFLSRAYTRVMANLDAASRWSSQTGWARRAVEQGLLLARSARPDAVVVSSPPHPTQLAGPRLAAKLGVPLVADFRDPWLFGELDDIQSAAVDLYLGRGAQQRVFQVASRVVLNTAWAGREAAGHDPSLAGRVAAIPNGYDPRSDIGRPDPEVFRVSFVGWLYDFMKPAPILAACARLRDRESLTNLRIEFVGTSAAPGGVSLVEQAKSHRLEGLFEHRPRVSRAEALGIQERSAAQVVFDYPGPLRVPMKFYDGAQGYGDLLLIGRHNSALAEAAGRIGLTVCPPEDPAAIDAALQRALRRWRDRDYQTPVDANGVLGREHTCRLMLELLNDAVETGAPGPRNGAIGG